MGAFAFRTDPSIALRGIPRPFDPIQAYSRIANLRRLQQRGQFNQRQLEEMERKRARLEDIRGIAAGAFEPGKGLNRAEFLQSLAQKHPLAALEFETKFAGQAKDEAALRKSQLENASKMLGIVGQVAGPGDALEKGGADPATMKVAYADALERLAALGVPTDKLPQEYTPGLFARALVEAVTEKDRIDQALRADEAAERKAAREKKVPGVHVPFPADVEAQKRRLARAGRVGRRTATEIQIELYQKDPELYEQIFDRVGIRSERQMRLKIIEAAMRLTETVTGQVDPKLFAQKLAELSAIVGVELLNQPSKPATREEVEAFAQEKGISYEEAEQQYRSAGYTIQ